MADQVPPLGILQGLPFHLAVRDRDYGMLVEGDTGTLTQLSTRNLQQSLPSGVSAANGRPIFLPYHDPSLTRT